MLNRDELQILQLELCLSLLKLRARTDLVKDIIPCPLVPKDLKHVLQELNSNIGPTGRLSETDKNTVALMLSIVLIQLNQRLYDCHAFTLEENLDLEIEIEHIEDILAALVRLLSQQNTTTVKRQGEETATSSKRFKLDVTDIKDVTAVPIQRYQDVPESLSGGSSWQVEKPLLLDREHVAAAAAPGSTSELRMNQNVSSCSTINTPVIKADLTKQTREASVPQGVAQSDCSAQLNDGNQSGQQASIPALVHAKPAEVEANKQTNDTNDTEVTSLEIYTIVPQAPEPANPSNTCLSLKDSTLKNENQTKAKSDTNEWDTTGDYTGAQLQAIEIIPTNSDLQNDYTGVQLQSVEVIPTNSNRQNDFLLVRNTGTFSKVSNNLTCNKDGEPSYIADDPKIKQLDYGRNQMRKESTNYVKQGLKVTDNKNRCCKRMCKGMEDLDCIRSSIIELSVKRKQELIKKYVTETACSRTSVASRRCRNRKYHLPVGESPTKEICKVTFMDLLGISSDFIDTVFRPNRKGNTNFTKQEEIIEVKTAAAIEKETHEIQVGTGTCVIETNSDSKKKIEVLNVEAAQGHGNTSKPEFILTLPPKIIDNEEYKSIQTSVKTVSITRGQVLQNQTIATIAAPISTVDASQVVLSERIGSFQLPVRPLVPQNSEKSKTVSEPVNTSLNNINTGNTKSRVDSLSKNEFNPSNGDTEVLVPLNSKKPSMDNQPCSSSTNKKVEGSKPQAAVPPKKRPQLVHSVISSNPRVSQQNAQSASRPDLVSELDAICQTKVLQFKEELTNEDVDIILYQARYRCTDLREICIQNKFLSNSIFEQLIQQQRNLKKLKLVTNNALVDIRYIAQGLTGQAGTLNELDLSYSVFSPAQIKNILLKQKNLTSLTLKCCDMQNDHMKALADGLNFTDGKLQMLEIGNNVVGSSAGDIGKALTNHKGLYQLLMWSCHIEPEDMKVLCEWLKNMDSLKVLDISYNKIGSETESISHVLRNNHKLFKLDVGKCDMEPCDVKALCEGLRKMKGSLEELYLNENNVGPAAADVAQSLTNHHKLWKLDMQFCKMETDHVKALCEGLGQMKGSLKELNLAGNQIGSNMDRTNNEHKLRNHPNLQVVFYRQ